MVVLGTAFAEESKSPKFWVEADYLGWFIKKNPLPPPLLTTASETDPLPGAIGQPGTHVVLGRKDIRMGWMNGFQVGGGSVIDANMDIEGSYFLLPTISKRKSISTSGEPGAADYAVPVFDITGVLGLNGIPGETVFILPGPLFNAPGFFGLFKLRISSRFQGAELNEIYHCIKKDPFQLDCLGGFRWLQLKESLIFKAKTNTVPNFPSPFEFFNFSDRFQTDNNFLGAQLGIRAKYAIQNWDLEGILKGALGATLERIKIKGSSQTSGGNLFFLTRGIANECLPGGIFAQPTNIGTHRKSSFAGTFEAHVRSGYRIINNLDVHIGYTFLWLSKVLRPGNQIDRKINSTLTALADASRATVGTGPGPIPFGEPAAAPSRRGSKKPKVRFKTSSFYAQGIDVGATFHF